MRTTLRWSHYVNERPPAPTGPRCPDIISPLAASLKFNFIADAVHNRKSHDLKTSDSILLKRRPRPDGAADPTLGHTPPPHSRPPQLVPWFHSVSLSARRSYRDGGKSSCGAGGGGEFTQGTPGYLGVGVSHQLQQHQQETNKKKKSTIGNELLSSCVFIQLQFRKLKRCNKKIGQEKRQCKRKHFVRIYTSADVTYGVTWPDHFE